MMKRVVSLRFGTLLGAMLLWVVACTSEGPPTSVPDDANAGTPELQAVSCNTSALADGDPEHESAKLVIDYLVALVNGASNSEFAHKNLNGPFQKKCRNIVAAFDTDRTAAIRDQVNGLIAFVLDQERKGAIEKSAVGARSADLDPPAPVGDQLLFYLDLLLGIGDPSVSAGFAAAVIGPDGGCMESTNGVFQMCFDAGAVGEETLFTAQPINCDTIAGKESASPGPCYRVEPSMDFPSEKFACVVIESEGDVNGVATISGGEEEILPECSNPGPITATGIQLAGTGGGLTSHSSPFYPVLTTATIEGTISDSSTDGPISGASVDLFCEGDETAESPRQSTTSAGDGSYFFEGDTTDGGFDPGNTCDVHVSAEGYFFNSSGDFTVQPGTNTQDIALDPATE
jgi:hypothetical protein